MSRLAIKYQKEIVPVLQKEWGFKNSLEVPCLLKVVINIGSKEAAHDQGVLLKAQEELAAISGQKPAIRKAKKSIAAFKLVQGDPVGIMVTLRGKKMYDFLDKLFNLVLPKVRDFRGVSLKSFDGQGNYNLGIDEQIVFPELEFIKIDKVRGLEVTIVTNTNDETLAKRLLELLGMPFTKPDLTQSKPAQKEEGGPSL